MGDCAVVEKYIEVSPPVTAALNTGIFVVAIECGSFCSLPYPENLRRMQEIEQAVWQNNCVPAFLALIRGKIRVGITEAEADMLMRERIVCSRAELPAAAARKQTAALLPSAALVAARLAEVSTVILPAFGDEAEDLDAAAISGRMIFTPALTERTLALLGVKSMIPVEEEIAAEVWLLQSALGSPESIFCQTEVTPSRLARSACRVAMDISKRLDHEARARSTAPAQKQKTPLCATCPNTLELRRMKQEQAEREQAEQEEEARRAAEEVDIYEEVARRYPVRYDVEEEEEYDSPEEEYEENYEE